MVLDEQILSELANFKQKDIIFAAENNVDLCQNIMDNYGSSMSPFILMSKAIGFQLDKDDVVSLLKENRPDLYSVIVGNLHVRAWIDKTVDNINARIF